MPLGIFVVFCWKCNPLFFSAYLHRSYLTNQVKIHFSLSRCQVWEEGQNKEKAKPTTALYQEVLARENLGREKTKRQIKN